MERSKHLQWCKDRALEYCDDGDIAQAWASMVSDLGKHEKTAGHSAIALGTMMVMGGQLKNAAEMEKFINGFN